LIITALLFMNSARGVCLTAARVLMSLGRDEVLPCSGIFQVVKLGEPIYGLLLSLCVSLVCGLVQLGSTAAFSSLLGSATILFEITYGERRARWED
jgi:amino acid transporter